MIQNYRESQFPMLKAARTLKWNWLFSSKLLVKNVKNLDNLAQCCNFWNNNEL